MKKFNVSVNGNSYEVEVEEILSSNPSATTEQGSSKGAKTSVNNPGSDSKATKTAESTKTAAAPKPKKETKPAGAGAQIAAPMPGTVLDIKVNVGDKITNGQVVALLEAMKMENEIKASGEGTVKEILVAKQDSVDTGDPLIILE